MNKECLNCGFWDYDYEACECPDEDMCVACPIERELSKEKRYLINDYPISFKKYTLKEAIKYFNIFEDDEYEEGLDKEYEEAREAFIAIRTIDDLRIYVDNYVNNWFGEHYHNYVIEEW